MPTVEVNYLAVLVGAVSNMVIGSFWYSMAGFGKPWMRLVGLSKEDIDKSKQAGMAKTYAIAFVGALVTAYVLAHFADYVGAQTISDAFMLGFWVWLGFVATSTLGDYLFAKKPRDLYLINNGYQLISLVVMAAIIVLWPF